MGEDKNFEEVTDISIQKLSDTDIILSWVNPRGCQSVDIYFAEESGGFGSPERVDDSSKRYGGLVFGRTYVFMLKAKHPGFQESLGISHSYYHEHTILPFAISHERIDGYLYRISWKIPAPGYDVYVLVNGVAVGSAKTEDGHLDIELPPNDYHVVSAEVRSCANNTASINKERIDTCLPMEIDKAATVNQIAERSISGGYGVSIPISLAGLPPMGVTGFYYVVHTDNKWAEAHELDGDKNVYTGIRQCTLANYERNGILPYDMTLQGEGSFYITVFTVYEDGRGGRVLARACAHIGRPLHAEVYWGVKKKWLEPPRLEVEIRANMPILSCPRLVLCACDKSARLLSYKDPNGQILCDIPQESLEEPEAVIKRGFNIGGRYDKEKKLYLFAELAGDAQRKVTFVPKPL